MPAVRIGLKSKHLFEASSVDYFYEFQPDEPLIGAFVREAQYRSIELILTSPEHSSDVNGKVLAKMRLSSYLEEPPIDRYSYISRPAHIRRSPTAFVRQSIRVLSLDTP